MSKDVLRNAWDRLRAQADLDHLHLADLRHEGARRYDELDVPTAQISKLLGHASLTTMTRYVNPTKKALRRAVDKLNEFRLAISCNPTSLPKSNPKNLQKSPPL